MFEEKQIQFEVKVIVGIMMAIGSILAALSVLGILFFWPARAHAAICESQSVTGGSSEVSTVLYNFATQFTATQDCTVDTLQLPMDDQPSGQSVKLAIWADNGSNLPGTLLFESALTSGFPTGCGTLHGASVSGTLTSGTKYWIGVERNSGNTSFFACYNNTGSDAYSSDGTTWNAQNDKMKFEIDGTIGIAGSSVVATFFHFFWWW